MLRLARILGTESGLRVCAPVHDAVLVKCGIDQVDQCVDRMRECMRVASEVVCPEFPLDTDVRSFGTRIGTKMSGGQECGGGCRTFCGT
jgi:hypothetical protein